MSGGNKRNSDLPAPLEEHNVPGLAAAKQALDRDAQANAVIEYAIRLKDWPLLEEAVAKKLDEQTEFIRWWREVVTVRQSPGGADRASTPNYVRCFPSCKQRS